MTLDERRSYIKADERGYKVIMGITNDDPRYLKLKEDGFILVDDEGVVFGFLNRRESAAIKTYGVRVRSPSARELRVYQLARLFEAKTKRP